MLLAVKAKRVTFTSSASSGSAAASGSCVSITLHCCRSLRATTNSVACMVSIPCASHAAIFAPSDECFATAMFKTVFDLRVGMLTSNDAEGVEGDPSRNRAQFTFGVQIPQLALENLSRRFARHRVH